MIKSRCPWEDADVTSFGCYCIRLEDGEHALFVVFLRVGTTAGFRVVRKFEV
jgi:hypothetical protein